MKKTLLFLTLSIALMLTSCKGAQGEKGEKGDPGVGTWKIIELRVDEGQWGYSNDTINNNNYFYADFDVPELTQFIYQYGMTQCYVIYDYDTDTPTQQLLPSVRHNEVLEGGVWCYYTETIDYDYGVGNVRVYLTQSDFNYERDLTWEPGAMRFRLVMLW